MPVLLVYIYLVAYLEYYTRDMHILQDTNTMIELALTGFLRKIVNKGHKMNFNPYDYEKVIACYPELRFVYDDLLDLIIKHGIPKLGRWAYCKYCYKHVLPHFSFGGGLIQCSECGAGLAPLKEVIIVGSYKQWEQHLELK